MYNMVFGHNDLAPALFAMLGLSPQFFDRPRDAWLNEDGSEIHVYTRLGGGNREGYEETWKRIQAHPLYLRDFDDEFDVTYATAVFRAPPEYLETCRGLADGTMRSGDARWQQFFAKLEQQEKQP